MGVRPDSGNLVGRSLERQILAQALSDVYAGQGRLILVGGEAGIGKTALVEDFIARSVTDPALVLHGACYDMTSTPPYGPWIDALRNEPGFSSGIAEPFIFDEAQLASLDDQSSLFQEVGRRLTQLSADQPVVILLEDLHWCDRASLDLLRLLGRTITNVPIMLIVTYRSDELTGSDPLSRVMPNLVREARAERIDVRPFQAETIGELINHRYALTATDRDRLIDYLNNRTDGNPFFITEMLRSLENAGALQNSSTGWRLGSLTDIGIPSLIWQVIERRLQDVSHSARRALQAAAVLGFEVRIEHWLSIIDLDEGKLAEVVQESLDAHLLEQSPQSGQLRFRHALVQDTLYSSVPLPWRQLQQRRVGELLAHSANADPTTVAEHFRRAGDARASIWSLRAARKARRLYAPGEIIEILSPVVSKPESLSAAEQMEALRLRGWAHETSGEFDAAHLDYLAELRIALDIGDRRAEWDALIRLAELWAGRDYDRAGEYIERSLTVAGEIDDLSLTAYSLNRLGNWRLNREDPERASQHHLRALEIFRELDDQSGIAATEDLLGMTCMLGGNPVDGARHYERAIDLQLSLDNRQGLVSSLANYSMRGATYQTDTMVADRTTLDECIADAGRALEIASQIAFRGGEIYAQVRLGSCLGSRGDYQEALEVIETSLIAAEEIGHRQWLSATCCVAGAVYLDMLESSTARVVLERGRAAAERSGTIHWIFSNSGILAMALLADGEIEDASNELQTTWAEDMPSRTMAQRQVWRSRIELELARHNDAAAVRMVDRVLAETPYASRERPAIRLSLLRGRALIGLNRPEEAVSWVRPARAVAREQGARPIQWRLHRELGVALTAVGDTAGADAEFAEARRLIEEIGSTISDPDWRSRFIARASQQLPRSEATTTFPESSRLTRRQQEVANLISLGYSNRQIADELSISERTVESHITATLSTLALESRSQIVAWRLKHGKSPDSPLSP